MQALSNGLMVLVLGIDEFFQIAREHLAMMAAYAAADRPSGIWNLDAIFRYPS